MATAIAKHRIDLRVQFEINEDEARALDALSGYGEDAFIKAFYEVMGQSYMKPHESGLRTFLKSIREVVNPALGMIDDARNLLIEAKNK